MFKKGICNWHTLRIHLFVISPLSLLSWSKKGAISKEMTPASILVAKASLSRYHVREGDPVFKRQTIVPSIITAIMLKVFVLMAEIFSRISICLAQVTHFLLKLMDFEKSTLETSLKLRDNVQWLSFQPHEVIMFTGSLNQDHCLIIHHKVWYFLKYPSSASGKIMAYKKGTIQVLFRHPGYQILEIKERRCIFSFHHFLFLLALVFKLVWSTNHGSRSCWVEEILHFVRGN